MAANRKSFRLLSNSLSKLSQEFYKKKNLDRIAERARSIIYKRVKSGKGVKDDSVQTGKAEIEKLKPLSDSYIAFRSGKILYLRNTKTGGTFTFGGDLKEFKNKRGQIEYRVNKKGKFIMNKLEKPKLGAFGSPKRSNLTLSGQLLESMTYRVSAKEIYIYIPSTSRNKINKYDNNDKTNKEVAEYVSKDRPFLAITSGELRILEREVDLIIGEILRSLKL
jgi:hypothetical protein